MSAEVALGVEYAIEAGIIFAKSELTTSLTASYAYQWSQTYTVSESITVTCDRLPDGSTDFQQVCLYQMQMYTEEEGNPGNSVTWNPSYTICTSSNEPPLCPPGVLCLNNECTECDWEGAGVEVPEEPSKKKEL